MTEPTRAGAHPTEEEIDETLEQTFPASDPPGWTLGLERSGPGPSGSGSGETELRRTEDGSPLEGMEMRTAGSFRPIDPGVDIGHVHLKVADLERALAFYTGVLGFELTQRYGPSAAFVSAGGYHHHIGLNTWESEGGSPPPPGRTGLYHLAIRYPTRAALADALRRLVEAGVPLDGASDHGVSEALYLRDPDQNGVELYWDRPEGQWPRTPDGGIAMYTRPLDVQGLLSEAA
jgi:catechol 2,3-dioxygenase